MWFMGFFVTSLHIFLIFVNGTPLTRKNVQLKLGGKGDPNVVATKSGASCNVNIPDVPQPYGESGRYSCKVNFMQILRLFEIFNSN